jgi:catalase
VKFYTEDGNWDLVGNNLKVFFIRDAIKFPDVIHSLKPDPVTNIQDTRRVFDFMSQTPEAMHMLTFLFSPWGIPASYRFMEGSGVNTYKWYNAEGEGVLVKYHFVPKQGVKNLTQEQANQIQAKNFNHSTQDLYAAIQRGDFPEWEFCVQIMSDDEHPELDFDPLDDTKIWPEDQFPLLPVGKMVLNRNPQNYFAEVEQASFGTACSSTDSIFPTTRCCRAAPSRTRIRNGIASGQITCSCRSMRQRSPRRRTSETAR